MSTPEQYGSRIPGDPPSPDRHARAEAITRSDDLAPLLFGEDGVGGSFSTAASAAVVNRTHRIVHARALGMQKRRRTLRELWVPLAFSCTLLAVVIFAVWSILDQYEAAPLGLPDSGQQMLVLTLWCLPVTLGVLAAIWLRRKGTAPDGGGR